MQTELLPVPENNLMAYGIVFSIEVGLRELLIQSFESKNDAKWWKTRLPGDVLQKYREGREHERTTKWSRHIPHHPLYYIDFPDLRKVIERADNWKDVFTPIFGDQTVLSGMLRELEPIRNKVAHSRKVTVGDVRIAEAAFTALEAAVGAGTLERLILNCTTAAEIPELLTQLQQEGDEAFSCCGGLEALSNFTTWPKVKNAWWFDESYLGCTLDEITEYFECLTEYNGLPRRRGAGHIIEAWYRKSRLGEKHTRASATLCSLIRSAEDN